MLHDFRQQNPMQRVVLALDEIFSVWRSTLFKVLFEFIGVYYMSLVERAQEESFCLLHCSSSRYNYMSFWDINQFLAEEEKIQFSLSQDAYFIDFLDPTKQGLILKQQTITAPIWLVNTLFDYLQLPDCELKVNIPEDLQKKSLDRINSFRTSIRGNVQHVRTKAQMPFYYEIYEAIKKITTNDSTKMTGEQISNFLEQKGKRIINRASGIFEQTKVDSITNNYSKFQSEIFKIARSRALEYHNWKTS